MKLSCPLLFCAAILSGRLAGAPEPTPIPTVIESAGLAETVSTDTETTATFHDKVVVTGTDLKLFCDDLRVVAIRKGDPTATLGQYGSFKSLVATGHVRIVQGAREATCGRAEIFPGEDKIVLSEEPVIRFLDEDYVATGPKMSLYRGQRRAVIEGNPNEPTRITLPAIKDLGFDKDQPKPAAEKSPQAAPAK